jgi:hypothetical protein
MAVMWRQARGTGVGGGSVEAVRLRSGSVAEGKRGCLLGLSTWGGDLGFTTHFWAKISMEMGRKHCANGLFYLATDNPT